MNTRPDIATVAGDIILGINSPEALFTSDFDIERQEYRKLRSRFHPDRPDGNATVFDHIEKLHIDAQRKLAEDDWQVPGLLNLRAIDGRQYEMPYLRRHRIDLGDMYIGERNVAFVLDDTSEDLLTHGVLMLAKLRVELTNRGNDLAGWFPEHTAVLVKTMHKRALVLKKTRDMICLHDLLNHCGGKLDPRHVAWIVSRLYHTATFLKVGPKLMHGGLDTLALFVDPGAHRVATLGGWWFAQALGAPLLALPPRAVALGVAKGPRPRASAAITGELVRAIGRELLGDANGSRLLMDKTIPKPMVYWLRGVADENTLKDYETWYKQVLVTCFGKPAFVELKVSAKEVYK